MLTPSWYITRFPVFCIERWDLPLAETSLSPEASVPLTGKVSAPGDGAGDGSGVGVGSGSGAGTGVGLGEGVGEHPSLNFSWLCFSVFESKFRTKQNQSR